MARANWPMLDRSRVALLAALAIDNFGSGLFLPLAILYASREVGLGVDTAGGVIAAATVLGFAVPPVAGRLTHRIGPRAVVIAAQALQGLGAVAYFVAANATGVFVAAALMAAGIQLFYCAVFVLISDVSTGPAKERPFALIAMVRGGAFGLGNLAAALALAWDSHQALRLLVAVDAMTFAIAASLLALFVTDPRAEHADERPVGVLGVLRDRRYVILMATTLLTGVALNVALVGTPVYVIEVLHGPAWLPGALLAMGTVLGSVAGLRVVDAVSGFRRTRALQAGALILAVWAFAMVGLDHVRPDAVVACAFAAWLLLTAAGKISDPIAGALSEALPPRGSRSVYMATYQYAFTAAQVLAPAIVVLFAISRWLPWGVVAAVALVAVPLLGMLERALPPELNVRPEIPVLAPQLEHAPPS
jgi:MFS family permease